MTALLFTSAVKLLEKLARLTTSQRPKKIETRNLGEAGNRCVKYWVDLGQGYCPYLRNLPIMEGQTCAPVPAGVSETRIEMLETGGMFPDGLDMEDWRLEHIQEQRGALRHPTLLF